MSHNLYDEFFPDEIEEDNESGIVEVDAIVKIIVNFKDGERIPVKEISNSSGVFSTKMSIYSDDDIGEIADYLREILDNSKDSFITIIYNDTDTKVVREEDIKNVEFYIIPIEKSEEKE